MAKANPMRGQAPLGGRLLHMTFGAWIAFEADSGRKINEHLLDLELGLSCGDLVGWLCAFTEGETTKEEAIELVSTAGFPETLAALRTAVASFFGPLAEEKKENPPKAA